LSGSDSSGDEAPACPPSSENDPVEFRHVAIAQANIKDRIIMTPCQKSLFLSEYLGIECYLKKELFQQTGSFKERGALNRLLNLSAKQKEVGVVAASAGNHALALAYHGKALGIPVTVVMPVNAPITKVSRSKGFGATVMTHGAHIGQSKEYAMEEFGHLEYINGYDDADIISGAGTIGLEIMDQVPDVDAVVVPCGGGGLLAGIGLAVKTLKPECQVIAVEPANCASFTEALRCGAPTPAPTQMTLADGLAVPQVGDRAFAVAKSVTDSVVTVSEKQIAIAILRCIEDEKLTVEGGGAAGLAALLPGGPLHSQLAGKKVVVPLCGGNIDTPQLGRVIERGLAADGRLVRFVATVSDKPGGISELTNILFNTGASVKDIYHERAWLDSAVDLVQMKVVVEVASFEHGEKVREELQKRYPLRWGAEASLADSTRPIGSGFH